MLSLSLEHLPACVGKLDLQELDLLLPYGTLLKRLMFPRLSLLLHALELSRQVRDLRGQLVDAV